MPTRAGRVLMTFGTAVLLGVATPAAADTGGLATPDDAAAVPSISPGDDFDTDYQVALDTVDAWWAAHWSEYFPGSYTAPSLVEGSRAPGLYDYPQDEVYCGDVLLQGENAWYCGAGDFLAFEVDLMMRSQDLGDAFVYLVVAHEWAHAVTARIDPALVSEKYELQADCLAGAALQGAVDDGSLRLEDGDNQEFVDSLAAVASDVPWGTVYVDANGQEQVEVHGSAQERTDAFDQGAGNGVTGCLSTSIT
jgi:predicted metalloprotease